MNRLFVLGAVGLSVFFAPDAGSINSHAADLWVDARAAISGNGTASKPFKTIQQAAQIAIAGDTIHVLPGIYRERVMPAHGGEPGRPVTYQSEVLHEAIVTGSDVWSPAWQNVGHGIFAAEVDDALFSDTNYVDGGNPFRIAYNWDRERNRAPYPYTTVQWTLGQVFADEKLLRETSSRKELEGVTQAWWFDPAANRIEVNLAGRNPATCRMEITTRRGVFRPHQKGLGYIVVRGFVFEHCANQFPGEFWKQPEYAESGMVGTRGGHHWLIESNIIRQAKSIGLTFGTSGRDNWDNEIPAQADPPVSQVGFDRIRGNSFVANGAIGAMGYGHHEVEVSGNLFISNNALLNTSYETGGLKTHFAYDLTVAGNWFVDNECEGAWLDNTWKNCRVERNLFAGNRGKNLFFEMDDNSAATEARVADNIFLLDGRRQLSPGAPKPVQFSDAWSVGIYGHDASGVRLENNLIAGEGYGIYFRKMVERKGGAARVTAFRNLLVGDKLTAVCLPAENPPHVTGNNFDANVYPDTPRPFAATGWSLAGAQVDQPVVNHIRELALAAGGTVSVFGKPERPSGYYLSLNQWQKVMSFDTQSRQAKIRWSFDQKKWQLKLILPSLDSLPAADAAALTKTDYFGRSFSGSIAVGPFASLTGGTNIIQLPAPGPPAR